MSILFTVCGRAGSKGIKEKNVRPFLKYPLPYYTLSAIELFCAGKDLDYDIVVSTDSEKLKKLTRENFGDLSPDPLLVKLTYSHPTLSQRIAAIDRS